MARCFALLFLACFSPGFVAMADAAEPARLILDTDIGNDIDDTFALAMIHAAQNHGDVHLLAVTVTKDNFFAAPFVDLMNTYYGHPHTPIGVVRNGKTQDSTPMIQVPSEKRTEQGGFFFPHILKDGREAPEAAGLLLEILERQPDHSVTIAQIGFSTNLARLLNRPGGRDLVARKVKELVVMGGNFKEPKPEYNIYTDPASAEVLLTKWPTPITFSGFEIGQAVTFPFQRVLQLESDSANPVGEACRNFFKAPEERPAWDPTAVLQALSPDQHYFEISQPGRVKLGPKNTTVFTSDPNGNCRHLIVANKKGAERAQAKIIELVMEPVRSSRRS